MRIGQFCPDVEYQINRALNPISNIQFAQFGELKLT